MQKQIYGCKVFSNAVERKIMIKLKGFHVVLACAVAGLLGAHSAQAQTACTPHSVNVAVLQVLEDAAVPGVYVSALQQGDIACVSNDARIGPQQLGYVVEKTETNGNTVAVGGWASVIFMTEQSAAATTSPTTEAPSTDDSAAEMAVLQADMLKFDQPVPYGPPQVRGKTLKELIEGEPMFAPIEGLDESLWRKNCSSCHEWNSQRLCEQGRSYLPRAAEVFRHQHPYGGAYKLSLMRWAKTGCN